MNENRICSKNKSCRVQKTSTCWASLWWQDWVAAQLDRGHQDLTWVSPGDAHISTPALLHLPLTAWLKLPISDSTHLESLSYRNFLPYCPLVLCICHLFQCHDVPDTGSTNVVRASEGSTARQAAERFLMGWQPLLWAPRAPRPPAFTFATLFWWCLELTL